ncbi:MAG: ornithine carbamoyltransferase [Acidobacteria bacterium]|nr:ornithine carbamoyltransferase [Acidobacteriota bacterium]MCW5969015.1 ornithine carbamoyltransferase [Blastocatellales bacterium]
MALKDLISLNDLTPREVEKIFETTAAIKTSPLDFREALAGRSVALIFEKPSLRTRITFDLGATQMGASCVYLDHQGVRLGERESVKDMALNLERWVDAIVARTYSHETVIELAAHSSVPVINGLSEFTHPCQGLTDYFTLTEKAGPDLRGFHIAYVGDGNNTCHSLIFGAAKLGATISIGTPKGYEPNSEVLKAARRQAKATGAKISVFNDPFEAVKGAHAVYTDVWASMGFEAETERRREIFSSFRVTKKLMSEASRGAFFMHCLPAHRGDEVDAAVIDRKNSIVYDQAENRLHTQKAIMLLLIQATQ